MPLFSELGISLHKLKDHAFSSPEERESHAVATIAVREFADSDHQESTATYAASTPSTIDIRKQNPGTVFRITHNMDYFTRENIRYLWGVIGKAGIHPNIYLIQHAHPTEMNLSYQEILQIGNSFYLETRPFDGKPILSVADFHSTMLKDKKNSELSHPLQLDIMYPGQSGKKERNPEAFPRLARLIPVAATIPVLK